MSSCPPVPAYLSPGGEYNVQLDCWSFGRVLGFFSWFVYFSLLFQNVISEMSCTEYPPSASCILLMFGSGFISPSFLHPPGVCMHSSHFSGLFGLLVSVAVGFFGLWGFFFFYLFAGSFSLGTYW